jgi:methionyl-tRNA formyltransferase
LNAAPRSLRLGFAGTPQFAVAALDALAASRHQLAAVFTKPDKPSGRGQALQFSPVKQRAIDLGVPVYQPASFKTSEVLDLLRGLQLDALIVVAYGLILPPAALAVPAVGCFNIHASLLPRWRGAAPIHRALLAGDAATGITIMRMEAGLDTGPMLAVRQVQIGLRETAGTLHDRLAVLGGELIVEALDAIAAGEAQERPQPTEGVTYAEKISKAEALIDWDAEAAAVLRRVRAFNPWPVAETQWDGAQLRIWEAELAPAGVSAGGAGGVGGDGGDGMGGAVERAGGVGDVGAVEGAVAVAAGASAPGTVLQSSDDGVDVACGRGALRLLRLQLAGRKPLAAQEFIKAQRLAGVRFTSS